MNGKRLVVFLSQSALCLVFSHPSTALTLAEMRHNLLDGQMLTAGIQGSVTWLKEGISIEDAQ